MELKPGYKQTEVGVIPEEWEVGSLDKFWTVIDCKHVTAAFMGNGFPIASIKEVQSRFVDLTNAKQTTQYFYNMLIEGGRKPQPGDLILSRNATVGEVAQVMEWHPPFAMGQDVCLLRRKLDDFSAGFLQAIFQSHIIVQQLLNLMVGSTFKRANIEQIRSFYVPMPSPPEQRAIAEALSDVDALLAALDRLIAKQRDLKQAAMQQLLTGQTRLPGFTGEWEVKPLRKACTLFNGRAYALHEWETSGVPVIRLQNLTGGDEYYYSTMQLPEQKYCNRGDLLYMWSATFGPHFWMGEKAIYHYHIWKVVPNDEVATREFLFYKLFEITDEKKTRSTNGGTMLHVTKSSMESTPLVLPPLPEQTAIAAVLTDIDAELAALEARRDKTRLLKQAMMQELLTGRTRLL